MLLCIITAISYLVINSWGQMCHNICNYTHNDQVPSGWLLRSRLPCSLAPRQLATCGVVDYEINVSNSSKR